MQIGRLHVLWNILYNWIVDYNEMLIASAHIPDEVGYN